MFAVVIALPLIWLGAWFFLAGIHMNLYDFMVDKTHKVTAKAGFSLENVLVEGRENTDSETVLSALGVDKGQSVFRLDIQQTKTALEEIPWVKSVRIERRLPETIYIKLTERTPFALWYAESKLSVIGVDGHIITDKNVEKFKDLPMIKGEGAQKGASGFFRVLKGEEELLHKVDHAQYIDKRRWDLILKGGQRIKLPEKDVEVAVAYLMRMHEKNNMLGVDTITDIDARYKDRLIIRTKLGTVQDYIENSSDAGVPL